MITFILAFILSLQTGLISSIIIIQSESLRRFVPGDNVTFHCRMEEFYENYYSWFRQSLGEAPTCIITLYSGTAPMRHGAFKEDKRFTADKKGTQLTLSITNTKEADSGIYYCAARDYDLIVFSNGIFLEYEGPTLKSFQYHLNILIPPNQTENTLKPKDPVHPGDSVTLQCSVLTESCSGDHSVYWFRHRSGESHPGIIFTHGNRSDQCKKSSETVSPTQSCIYKLPKNNLSLSDAGTYYCAVAACGEILFGNRSRLEITESNSQLTELNWTVIALAVSNAVCLIIIAALLCTRAKKRNVTISGHPEQTYSASASSISPVNENAERENLSYAALNFPTRKSKRRETQRDTTTNVVYSSVSAQN
ncbi:novel immune-type receptor 12 [Astyanax mexicanus]|uniref:novel immune-type receptor 12 n=1 Tax=Astyanax mexicanus TaxID=7994 RepID=UPI0020CAB35E|nr:novel immune-type receptor 12 [Astyanax mexicanus]